MMSFIVPVVFAVILRAASAGGRLEASSNRLPLDVEPSRDLLSLPRPFDFYNGACQSACDPTPQEHPFLNACPKCADKYSACNSCCFGGASSLKMRWHGCDGNLSLVTRDQGQDVCNTEFGSNSTSARFVDCACLDIISNPRLPRIGCGLSDSVAMNHGNSSSFFDVCLVSVIELEKNRVFLDLSSPLPEVIGLKYSGHENEYQTDATWGPYGFTTYFDTTCNAGDDSLVPYPYPLFPGYGKFPGTCSDEGFIDLKTNGATPLPDEIDHYQGSPPKDSFWFEFLDGTSSGFWPESPKRAHHFNPKFSVCGCNECNDPMSATPVGTPTDRSNSDPTTAPTQEKDAPQPTRQPKQTRSPKMKSTKAPTAKGTSQPPTFLPRANKGPPPPATLAPNLNKSQAPSGSSSREDSDDYTGSPITHPTSSFIPTVGASSPSQWIKGPTSLPSYSSRPSNHLTLSSEPSLVPTNSVAPNIVTEVPSEEPTHKVGGNPGPPASEQPTVVISHAPSHHDCDDDTTIVPSASSWASEEPTRKVGGNPGPPSPIPPSNFPTESLFPSMVPSKLLPDSLHPSIFTTSSPSPKTSQSNHPSGSLYPSTMPSELPSSSLYPSGTPSLEPSSLPSTSPSRAPSMSAQPTIYPSNPPSESVHPSNPPSIVPSKSEYPSLSPSNLPSESAFPSILPSYLPSASQYPSTTPSSRPTSEPTPGPSVGPTHQPSLHPTSSLYPSYQPTETASEEPTGKPSGIPSTPPSNRPTRKVGGNPGPPSPIPPSEQPTAVEPSVAPTLGFSPSPSHDCGTDNPTMLPSPFPSVGPTTAPSATPSEPPTQRPSDQPSGRTTSPTDGPSANPSSVPTPSPTAKPTGPPTQTPFESPSTIPSSSPSGAPSAFLVFDTVPPSNSVPSLRPSANPSPSPSAAPTVRPTSAPTSKPSLPPSVSLSTMPTQYPTGMLSGNPGPGEPMNPSNPPSTPSTYGGCEDEDIASCNRRAVLNCQPSDPSNGVLCIFNASQSDEHQRKLEILKRIDSRLNSGETFQTLSVVETRVLKDWIKQQMKHHLDEIVARN